MQDMFHDIDNRRGQPEPNSLSTAVKRLADILHTASGRL